MKLGAEWNFDRAFPIEEQAKLMKENGFDYTFLRPEDERLGEILSCLKQYGITCENCHAPFDGINDMWKAGDCGEIMLQRLLRCVDVCADNEIPLLVVHLSSGQNPPRMNDIGFDRYDRLMKRADEQGITVAYENIRRLDNVVYMLENYPKAAFCWDVGHEACYTGGMEFMPLFSKRIGAIHLHDNTAIYDEDLHLLPYDGRIDMERAAEHLAKSPYQGSIMLEVTSRTARIESNEMFFQKAYRAAEKFARRVEDLRKEYQKSRG